MGNPTQNNPYFLADPFLYLCDRSYARERKIE